MLDKRADEHKGREDVRIFVNLYVCTGQKRVSPGPENMESGKRTATAALNDHVVHSWEVP